MKCVDCKHWRMYRPIGGVLPAIFRGQGSCYPDGIKGKKSAAMTAGNEECRMGRFEEKEVQYLW